VLAVMGLLNVVGLGALYELNAGRKRTSYGLPKADTD